MKWSWLARVESDVFIVMEGNGKIKDSDSSYYFPTHTDLNLPMLSPPPVYVPITMVTGPTK